MKGDRLRAGVSFTGRLSRWVSVTTPSTVRGTSCGIPPSAGLTTFTRTCPRSNRYPVAAKISRKDSAPGKSGHLDDQVLLQPVDPLVRFFDSNRQSFAITALRIPIDIVDPISEFPLGYVEPFRGLGQREFKLLIRRFSLRNL